MWGRENTASRLYKRELMPHGKVGAVCSENHPKPESNLHGQKAQFVNAKSVDTYNKHWALEGSVLEKLFYNTVFQASITFGR